MTKKLILITLLLSLISIPAKANSCNMPFLEDGIKKTGTINYQVLFVKYPDSSKKTKGYIKNHISMLNLKEVSTYFQKASYGKTKIKFRIYESWINLPNNSYDYRMHTSGEKDWREIEQNYLSAVINASDSVIDFSKIDGVLIVSDPDLSQMYVALRDPYTADGKSIRAVAYNQTNSFATTHEILHTLGLKDLYETTDIWGPRGGMEHYSIMSQYYGGTNMTGFEKYSLGWMSPNDVICQESGSKNVKLSSLDSKGTKLMLLPINGQEMLGIEYRKNEGVDKYLGSSGVLIYHIKSNVQPSLNNTGVPMTPIFFGNKGNIDFQGINININKNTITVNR